MCTPCTSDEGISVNKQHRYSRVLYSARCHTAKKQPRHTAPAVCGHGYETDIVCLDDLPDGLLRCARNNASHCRQPGGRYSRSDVVQINLRLGVCLLAIVDRTK